MAKSVLDIVIKLSKQGGADRETITGLAQIKTGLMQAGAVAGTFVAAYYAVDKILDATVGVMVKYAGEVRNTMRATSLSAEESSRLIQVTDDLGVSYETLQKAIKSSADSTDFSIEGLARTSQAYLEIGNAQERAKFAQQQYGKAWVDMVGVLEKGPDAIRQMASEISGSLVLDQKAIDQTRQYEIAVDQLNDAKQALAITMGSKIIPLETQIISGLANSNQLRAEAARLIREGAAGSREEALAMAQAELATRLYADATANAIGPTDGLSTSMDAVTMLGDSYLSMAMSLTDQQQSYNEKMTDLNAKRAEEVRVLNQLIALGPANAEQIEMQRGKIAELDGQINATNQSMEEFGAKFMLSMLQASGASMSMQIAYAQASGLISGNSAAIMEAIAQVNQQYQDGIIDAHGYQIQVGYLIAQLKRLDGMTSTATVNIVVNGSIPRIGGGSWNPSQGQVNSHVREGSGAAEGGSLSNFTVVGEKGFEAIVRGPNGQYTVIPHEASKWLLEAGLMPKGATKFLGLGGGLSGGGSKPNTLGSKTGSFQKSSSGYNKPSGRGSSTEAMFTIGGNGGGGDASSEQMSLATDQAQATKEAAQAAAQVAAVSSDSSMQASNQTAQVVSTIARGNEDIKNELQDLNSQMRDLRAELPSTLASAVQTEI